MEDTLTSKLIDSYNPKITFALSNYGITQLFLRFLSLSSTYPLTHLTKPINDYQYCDYHFILINIDFKIDDSLLDNLSWYSNICSFSNISELQNNKIINAIISTLTRNQIDNSDLIINEHLDIYFINVSCIEIICDSYYISSSGSRYIVFLNQDFNVHNSDSFSLIELKIDNYIIGFFKNYTNASFDSILEISNEHSFKTNKIKFNRFRFPEIIIETICDENEIFKWFDFKNEMVTDKIKMRHKCKINIKINEYNAKKCNETYNECVIDDSFSFYIKNVILDKLIYFGHYQK